MGSARRRAPVPGVAAHAGASNPPRPPLAAHADWSVAPGKRWVALARPVLGTRREGGRDGWRVSVAPVGEVATLLARLLRAARGGPVAFGLDAPIGLPRAYAAHHAADYPDFPAFLRGLAARPGFFEVCDGLHEVGPERPFYPRRGRAGMTRLSHAWALGLPDAAALLRACDRATTRRPAGAPPFWTLGANQSGKAALAAWRDLLLPALVAPAPALLWPFDGALLSLLRPGRVAVAETYPAEALRHLGLAPPGSKRRRADRAALAAPLRAAMARLHAAPDPATAALIADGFGADPAGEDRLDCLLGLLCVLGVLAGHRPDGVPPGDPWLTRWEGWTLGQTDPPLAPPHPGPHETRPRVSVPGTGCGD